jgi:hypothetical protein
MRVESRGVIFWLVAKKEVLNLSLFEEYEGGVDMCKKLSVFCLLLVATVASAADITNTNPLNVDIDGENTVTSQAGWSSFVVPRDFAAGAPQSVTINNGGTPSTWPTVEFTYYQPLGNVGGSRNRSGGMAFNQKPSTFGTQAGGAGFGRSYSQVKVSGSGTNPAVKANTEYTILVWSFETSNVWTLNSENPNSKYSVWSQLNPNTWCVNNHYAGVNGDPNGYPAPWIGTGHDPCTGSGMPSTMATAAGIGTDYATRVFMQSPDAAWQGGSNWLLGDPHYGKFKVMSDSAGVITFYGWMDASDWGGSQHVPLNGFIVMPEPATVALLGLGGLLLRRKRS